MFGFFKKKKNIQYESISDEDKLINQIDLSWFSNHITNKEGFSRVNWVSTIEYVESNYSSLNSPRLWNHLVKFWVEKLSEDFLEDYSISESKHFILLSSSSDKYVSLFLKFLERAYQNILSSLHGIVGDFGEEKLAIIIIENSDLYYDYVSYYYPEKGTFAMSGGVYLNDGYGHFVFPFKELSLSESVASHELTHAMVSHLPLPVWLDEGLAVNMEASITGYSPYNLNRQKQTKHENFWSSENIQLFWSGRSFSQAGDISELSYQLAQLIVRSLSEDYETFCQFVNKASIDDSGEAAAIEMYGGSLGAIIEHIFGKDDCSPKPKMWSEIAMY